jgi:hypothetical protein
MKIIREHYTPLEHGVKPEAAVKTDTNAIGNDMLALRKCMLD